MAIDHGFPSSSVSTFARLLSRDPRKRPVAEVIFFGWMGFPLDDLSPAMSHEETMWFSFLGQTNGFGRNAVHLLVAFSHLG